MMRVSIKSQLRKSDQSTEGRFQIKQFCDEGLLGHGSCINVSDVDSKPGKPVSQNLSAFEEKPPHSVHFAARFSGTSPIFIE